MLNRCAAAKTATAKRVSAKPGDASVRAASTWQALFAIGNIETFRGIHLHLTLVKNPDWSHHWGMS